jgi:hypothetical protein
VGEIKERLKYLEMADLSHLLLQKRSQKAPFTNRNWRESYYFNTTDEKNQISLITTIGILPNKGRSSGFVIVIHKGRIVVAKLLLSRGIDLHNTDRFDLGRLTYRIEGIDWRLGYDSKKCSFDLTFRPLNEFYHYPKGSENFDFLFTDHVEQAGIFEGYLDLDGERMKFGLSFGHRDHSWGIRNWSSVDGYWLFSCTFGEEKAFNLWKGKSQGKQFQAGYLFDSNRNLKILSSNIGNQRAGKNGEPKACSITFEDEDGRKHQAACEVICSVPIPMIGTIVYETITRINLDGAVGYGLLERHVHDSNPFHKFTALRKIQKRKRGGP